MEHVRMINKIKIIISINISRYFDSKSTHYIIRNQLYTFLLELSRLKKVILLLYSHIFDPFSDVNRLVISGTNYVALSNEATD